MRTPNIRLILNKPLAVVAGRPLTPSPRRVFIAEHVTPDAVFPERISIGNDVMLKSGAMLLARYYQPEYAGHEFMSGEAKIGDGVYFGGRSLVVAGQIRSPTTCPRWTK